MSRVLGSRDGITPSSVSEFATVEQDATRRFRMPQIRINLP